MKIVEEAAETPGFMPPEDDVCLLFVIKGSLEETSELRRVEKWHQRASEVKELVMSKS